MPRSRVPSFLPSLLLAALPATLPAAESRPPNVILIYSDDHGWADLGVQGVDKDVRTPNLDQLARDGVRFTRGYVTAPQCTPSRAAVLTGRYQQRFGVEDNNHGPLPLAEVTIAERLAPAGYTSCGVGKCHLDMETTKGKGEGRSHRILPDHMPHHQGFTEYFRGEKKQFHASHALDGTPYPDAPHIVKDDRFRVVVQTEAALSFLDRRAAVPDKPWFLYLAWYAPHVPLESPEPWFSRTPESLPLARRQALAMIAAMDDGLGLIREKLKAMGADRDTLIFFISDNGAPLGNGWNGSLNLPFVGEKGMVSEGGVRVPFVAAWPGRWPKGGLPADPALDGVDLTPFVTGENSAAPHERLFWRWREHAAVLEMPFKLIRLGDRPPMLFDVTTPDGETVTRDLAASRPDVVARLDKHLTAWAADLVPPGIPPAG
ncbi:hypothetical protein EBZ02_05590, partial [bacterium]|nr:hypothetical protein [bacterium]